MRCLYLTPLKPPDHPTPSGDRLIARLFLRLLGSVGFDAVQASTLRTRLAEPDDLPAIEAQADREISRILAEQRKPKDPAALVFTYHNYYRAPDLVGPRLAAALGIPFVIAESSRASKRAVGPWAAANALAEAASDSARLILAPTGHDMAALTARKPSSQTVQHMPPFIDLADWPGYGCAKPPPKGPVRLLTVAMMRRGNKADSYLALADALAALPILRWTLDIVGDGEARGDIESRFAPFGSRVRFHGALDDRARLGALYTASDVFVWPAIEEPIGMVFLEAQAHALPCLAYGWRGVPDVIADGASGFVAPPHDTAKFTQNLAGLIRNPDTARHMGVSARLRVEDHHSMAAAAGNLVAAFKAAGLPLPRP